MRRIAAALAFTGCAVGTVDPGSAAIDIGADGVDASAGADASVGADALVDRADASDAMVADVFEASACVDAGDWSCLGAVTYAAPTMASVSVVFQARDLVTRANLAGVAMKLCQRDDALCPTPIALGVSDATGNVTMMVPLGERGFDGYVETTGGTTLPTRTFIRPPLNGSVTHVAFGIVSTANFHTVLLAAGVTADATRGHVGVVDNDCATHAAEGVLVALGGADASARPVYFRGSLPDPSATATDASGVVSFFNVSPGTYALTSSRACTGQRIGSAPISVRAGYLSALTLSPTP